MSRSTSKYLVLLAGFTGLFYWKTLLTKQFTLLAGSEVVDYTYSWLRIWIYSLRQGQMLLWDPYAFCGRPFHAEMLPSAFYPLHLPLLLVPFDRNGLLPQSAFHQLFALTHLLGAIFAFALIRELRLSRFAAFVGACCFSMCNLLGNMGWLPFQEACIWLPAIFLFLLRAWRAEQTRTVIVEASLGGLCLGMSILTGGLPFSMMQGIFVVTALVYYGVSSRAMSSRSVWLKTGLILIVILTVGGGIGAVQLLPSYEYGKLSLRFIDGGAVPADAKIPYHRLHPGMWPQSIVSTLFPTGFNGKMGGGEAYAMYIGVLPFFLAIAAIWRCWRHVWVRYLAGLAVAAFLYSLTEFSPLHGWLYATIPFLWNVRAAGRFVYLASFALAILAAFGVDDALERAGHTRSWSPATSILKWIAIGCAAALFVPAVFPQVSLGIWMSLSLLLILISCGCLAYLTQHEVGPWFRILVGIFILFDLTAFHLQEANKSAASKPADQLEKLISLRGAAGFVKAQPGLGRVQVAVQPQPNIGDAYGVHALFGGGGTMLKSYARLWQNTDLLNVRYVVKPATATEPAPVYQDANWKVYENRNAYPRAWLVHSAIVQPSQDAVFSRLLDPAIDLRKVALLETPLPHALVDAGVGTSDAVRFRSYEADDIRLEVKAASAGLLVLSEFHYPGWRATVNGEPATIYRVDGGLRGILVPAGPSQIALGYVPVTVYAGATLSLLTFLAVLSGLVLSWRQKFLDRRRLKEALPRSIPSQT